MVQIPPGIEIKKSDRKHEIAAEYLETVVNAQASQGWEFYRVDSVGVSINLGCLGMFFFGRKQEENVYYVITFRKPRQ
jgi:hypothetical protein